MSERTIFLSGLLDKLDEMQRKALLDVERLNLDGIQYAKLLINQDLVEELKIQNQRSSE